MVGSEFHRDPSGFLVRFVKQRGLETMDYSSGFLRDEVPPPISRMASPGAHRLQDKFPSPVVTVRER